mgnify:CR=1 FL=1
MLISSSDKPLTITSFLFSWIIISFGVKNFKLIFLFSSFRFFMLVFRLAFSFSFKFSVLSIISALVGLLLSIVPADNSEKGQLGLFAAA